MAYFITARLRNLLPTHIVFFLFKNLNFTFLVCSKRIIFDHITKLKTRTWFKLIFVRYSLNFVTFYINFIGKIRVQSYHHVSFFMNEIEQFTIWSLAQKWNRTKRFVSNSRFQDFFFGNVVEYDRMLNIPFDIHVLLSK